jgi:hypothetical protein
MAATETGSATRTSRSIKGARSTKFEGLAFADRHDHAVADDLPENDDSDDESKQPDDNDVDDNDSEDDCNDNGDDDANTNIADSVDDDYDDPPPDDVDPPPDMPAKQIKTFLRMLTRIPFYPDVLPAVPADIAGVYAAAPNEPEYKPEKRRNKVSAKSWMTNTGHVLGPTTYVRGAQAMTPTYTPCSKAP